VNVRTRTNVTIAMRWSLSCVFVLVLGASASAQCPTGYHWDRRGGLCRQTNCNSIPNAHWGYGTSCVCGSSGRLNGPEEPHMINQECSFSRDHAACPGCVYACVRLDAQCPPPPGQAAPASRSCDVDDEMVALETLANEVEQRGRGLQRLIQTDLPEFPELNYCVQASGDQVTVTINNDGSIARQVLAAVGAAEAAVGVMETLGLDLGATTLQSVGRSVAQSLRGRIIQWRAASRDPDAALAFMRESHQVAQGVRDVRRRMVCTVKDGVPELYTRYAELDRMADELRARIRGNEGCAQGLLRAIGVKVQGARAAYRWHAEGILRPPGAPRGGFVSRRTWLDRRIGPRGQPAIFSEFDCRPSSRRSSPRRRGGRR